MEEDRMSQLPDDILLLILDKIDIYEAVDKISQLPDDILLLILDKIDIYEAVETMILSHRWKNVWRSLTGLRFHFCPATTPRRIHLEDFTIHSSFVSHFLSHRDPAAPVHDFHLSFDSPSPVPQRPCGVDREFLEECVLYAINHGVQSLRLHWPTKDTLRLPAAFLTCETLRELELWDLFCLVELPGRLSLPNLKTILLHTIALDFADHLHSEDPFSSLPQLEKLTLINFGFDVIRAPKLRLLQIEDYGYYLTVREISAPLLTSFTCKSHIVWECARVNLPMLEQVYFDIHEDGYRRNHVCDANIVMMLHKFRNATTVSLSVDTLKMLECEFGSFEQTPIPFPNTKCLKVVKGGSTNRKVFQGVINYLTRTLNCEVEFSPSLFVSEHMTIKTPYDNVVQLSW